MFDEQGAGSCMAHGLIWSEDETGVCGKGWGVELYCI